MLEAAQYQQNCFATLTYDDDHVPEGGTLVPKDMQDWIKRLRKAVSPFKFRYYLVGEYGDESWRPHYHAALFGFASCRYGQSQYSLRRDRCCVQCELVRKTWGRGNIFLGTLEASSAGYLAGYVTKKMTSFDDTRLKGRHPEFGRMSLRPGIGFNALWELARQLVRYELDEKLPDVPSSLDHGRKSYPLGRYLQQNLRQFVGKEKNAPQGILDKVAAELLPVRLAARSDTENPSFKAHLVSAGDQKVLNMEARQRIFKRGRRL